MCKVQNKHGFVLALMLVLASLLVAVQINLPRDWRQQTRKVVSTPLQLHNQARRKKLPSNDPRPKNSKVVFTSSQSPRQTRTFLPPDDWKQNKSKVVSTLSQLPEQTRRVLPQCIIAGVKKSGTRALLDFLNLHTDVTTARKEMHFFDVDTAYERGLEWYRLQMPASMPHQLTIEKTPKYFVAVQAPLRVRLMNSTIRLLFIVRDPVARMVSDYLETMAGRNESNPPKFEELALAPNSDRLDLHYGPLQTSMYHVHLERWLQSFHRRQIHIVDGDVLVDDPATELRKVETFLGLEHQLTSDMFYRNESRGFYCSKIGHCLEESKGRKHPTVSQTVLDKLCQFFRPHNQLFFQLVGQEFNWC